MAGNSSVTAENRGQFGSKIGFILAAAGSAVGLGNIWKFPGKAYNGGGGAFILVYICLVALIGATVMLGEFVLGRKTKKNAIGAIRELNSKFAWVGGLGVLTGFIILCYYVQVGGWVIKYIVAYITEASAVYADPLAYFLNMLGADGKFPLQGAIIYPAIFTLLTIFIITRGVAEGIEKMSKILMPGLFILLIGLMIRSMTLPGAGEGVAYLLHVDLSVINAGVILSALGQAFFSLSLGMGVMITYGSYLNKEDNLVSNTGIVCLLDTLVALFAGFMIIPAVFATGVAPGMGGGFAFASLAGVFAAIPGGTIFGILFYFLLFFAAVTSSTSILEGTVAFLIEEKGFERKKTTIAVGCIIFVIGIFYTLAQAYLPLKGIWIDGTGISYPGFGDWMEFLTDRLLMPFGALFTCLFVGWIWGPKNGIQEATSDGKYKFALAGAWSFLIKFAAPIAIAAVILGGMVFGMALS